MGDACHFAHGEEDLRKVTDVRFINLSPFQLTFMNFISQKRLPIQPKLITKQCNAKTIKSLGHADLEIDVRLLTALSTISTTRLETSLHLSKLSLHFLLHPLFLKCTHHLNIKCTLPTLSTLLRFTPNSTTIRAPRR